MRSAVLPVTPNPAARVSATRANNNRRRVRRTPFRVPCRIRLVNSVSGEARTVVGETLNLSEGGAALLAPVDPPVGTWVETLIPHPNGDPLFLCGRVVHVRRSMATSFELGIAITDERSPAF